MKLYKRMIRPVLIEPDPYYRNIGTVLEEKWYPEEDADKLEEKYKDKVSVWVHLSFEEKFEAVDLTIKD